ncbi:MULTISPECIES: right-handed parallel beta-helix repeat-containing protein [unclassified Treponema]|uniref:right-handed parallel beta-helix repeat-containing protein n=1 Tax=unclassified Treponema TaxID=2638727 RepID=UPI0025CDC23E|nr:MULTISPECIES: right-handed parallel beta-helix repeat-containing protein [unclassified Treponema]
MKVTKFLMAAALVSAAAMFVSCSNLSESSESSSDSSRAASSGTTYSVGTASDLYTAANKVNPGDTIKLTANINLTKQLQLLRSGSSGKVITLDGNGKTLNCSAFTGWGVKVNGSYWTIRKLTVTKASDCGMVFQLGGNNRAEYCKFTYNGDSGLQVYNSAHDVTITRCESYYNYDKATKGENADGFAAKLSGGKNIKFNYCVAKYNSDDGWDLYSQAYPVTLNNCEASYNGYINSSLQTTPDGDGNGFKLGSKYKNVSHRVLSCKSTYNLKYGIDANGNTAKQTITNCTVKNNKEGQISSRTKY